MSQSWQHSKLKQLFYSLKDDSIRCSSDKRIMKEILINLRLKLWQQIVGDFLQTT